MPRPKHRATGGINSRLYWNGVFIGMVQNANFNRIFKKIAVDEAGRARTREHVFNGVVCNLTIGLIELITNTLQTQGLLPLDIDEEDLIDFEGGTLEFRTVKRDLLIVRAEDVTVSSDSLNFSRDTVWAHNCTFDATWFRSPRPVVG